MTKDDFAEKLAKKTDISKNKAHDVIDAIFSTAPREGIIAIELDAGRSSQGPEGQEPADRRPDRHPGDDGSCFPRG
jgi:hypothetical protein